jgi:hypothetical protein
MALAALAALVMIWWLFIRPGQYRQQAAAARAQGQVAITQAENARNTVRIVEKTHETITRVEQVQRDGVAQVLAAPDDAAGAAAARQSLCLLNLYQGSPACQRVRQPGAGQPESTNAGLANPARP